MAIASVSTVRNANWLRTLLFSAVAVTTISLAAQPAMPITVNTYVYDVQGRLKIACHAPEGAGYRTTYTLDKADNPTNLTSQNYFFGIAAGSGIWSADGRFYLTMQTDGNFVLWGPSGVLWATGTNGTGAAAAYFQQDGNLVLYSGSGAVWASATHSYCANLAVQNDGNVVIYSATGAVVWQTGTGGH